MRLEESFGEVGNMNIKRSLKTAWLMAPLVAFLVSAPSGSPATGLGRWGGYSLFPVFAPYFPFYLFYLLGLSPVYTTKAYPPPPGSTSPFLRLVFYRLFRETVNIFTAD